MAETKNCPYCGEEIQTVAIKCKHCGSWIDGRESEQNVEPNINDKRASFFTIHRRESLYGLLCLLGLVLVICSQGRYTFILDTIGVITYLGGWFLLSFGASKMALGLCKNPNKVRHGIIIGSLVSCLIALAASAYQLGYMIGGYECFTYLYPFAITFGLNALILMIFERSGK